MRAAAIVHFLDGALSISPGSCSASLRPIIHSQQSEGRIPTTQRPTIAQATASPSQGFLIALAFCGLAGSFLLTPRERIETPSLSVLFAHRAASRAKASELASHVVDSAALEQDVVSRYE